MNRSLNRVDTSIIGKSFGFLTVIEFSHSRNKKSYWKCICQCGNECIVCRNNLITGHTKSCGCYKPDQSVDITGCRANEWVAIKRVSKDKKLEWRWLFRCVHCGAEIIRRGVSTIKLKNIRKCDCQKKNKISEFKLCPICQRAFASNNVCCSRPCAEVHRTLTVTNHRCSDCGVELNNKNRTHKSTSSVCDNCMWLRRRKYKLREKLGKNINDETINKIVTIEILSSYGNLKTKKGDPKLWQNNQLMKRAETLLKEYR